MAKRPSAVLMSGAVALWVAATVGCGGTTDAPDETGPDASPPPVATGEQVASDAAEQRPAEMVRCMTDKGWHVEVRDGGWGDVDGVPEAQVDQWDADADACRTELGHDTGPPVITPEEAGEMYDLLVEVAECVRDLGYHVPEPPSRQSFVEDLVEYPIPSWHPYDVVYDRASGAGDIRRVEAACPIP
jgi:hypothetical protein